MRIRTGGFANTLALATLALAWTLGAGGCSKPGDATPAASAPGAPAAAAVSATPAPAPGKAEAYAERVDSAVAHTKYGDVTFRDIVEYGQTGLCTPLNEFKPTTQTVSKVPYEMVTSVTLWIASRRAACEEVKAKNDPELNKLLELDLPRQVNSLLTRYMLKAEIKDQLTSPTQEEIADYYEKIKPTFFQPASFTIRMLLLQTYEPYVAQEGDTLESIAQQVTGDPKAAANIRSDAPGRPLRLDPLKMAKPLAPGEKLLAPMSKERMEEVRARLEAILKDVRATTDTHERELKFTAAAKKYDESGLNGEITTPLPTGTKQNKPPLTEIVKAVDATPAGQVSAVFQTKHGYQAVYVVEKVTSHSLPMTHPAVRDMIVNSLNKARLTRLGEEMLGSLLENPKLKIDYELIAKGNALTSDTVVAVLGEDKLHWGDMVEIWKQKGSPREPARVRKMLANSFIPPLAEMLFRDRLKPQMEDPKSELGKKLAVLRTAYIGSAYISNLAVEAAGKELQPERVKAYYERNRERFFKTPAAVAFEVAFWPLSAKEMELTGPARRQALEELLKAYQAELAKVKSLDDYSSLKARLAEKVLLQGLSPMASPEPVPLETLPNDLRKAAEKLGEKQWSAPFIMGDESGVATVFVTKAQAAGYQTLEEASAKIRQDLLGELIPPALKRVEDEYTQRAGVEMAIKPPAPAAKK